MAAVCTVQLSVDKITHFLRSRSIDEAVIANFVKEKMDADAIRNSTEDDIRKLGLSALGDINALKSFAHQVSKSSIANQLEKRSLLESLLGKKENKRTFKAKAPQQPKARKETRKVLLGWLHYDDTAKRFIQVRYSKGGGTREVDLSLTATRADVISIGKDIFFENGRSYFGVADAMTFSLANFQKKEINYTLTVSGQMLPFTLGRYLESTKLSKARLYLTSKIDIQDNETLSNELDSTESIQFDNDLSDSDLEHDQLFESICQITRSSMPTSSSSNSSKVTNQNMESIEQCRALKQQQDKEYEESLQADQNKERIKKEALLSEIAAIERQEKLRSARESRIPINEPGEEEERITIHVRHVHLGACQRAFRKTETCAVVYDWVGSLSLLPENFILQEYRKNPLQPSEPITNVTSLLYMSECETTPQLENEVNFRGFGENSDDSVNDTLILDNTIDLTNDYVNDMDVVDIRQHTPNQLLEGDSDDKDEEETTEMHAAVLPSERGRYFRQVHLSKILDSKRSLKPKLERTRLELVVLMEQDALPCKIVELNRRNIVPGLMTTYSTDNEMMKTRVNFELLGEVGADLGGISREIYASFWQEGCLQYFDSDDSIYVPRPNGVSKDDLITLGKIISHGYLMTGIFPVTISQSYMQAMLCGEETVSDDFVLEDFENYLAPYEANSLQSILTSPTFDGDSKQFILNLEDRYGMRTMPNISNVKDIVVQMARSQMIETPLHTMSKIKKGMMSGVGKQLWEDVTVEDLDEVYRVQTPNPARVASLLTTEKELGSNAEESKYYEFLCRYVRTSDQKNCVNFLKFCTGSNTIVVQKISVMFFKSSSREPLPKAHTCGAVLELPCSGYPSFSSFKVMMDKLMNNPISYDFRFE